MSTLPGDSQKSLLSGMMAGPEGLLDSASDLLQATGTVEMFFEAKRSGILFGTGESLVVPCEEGVCSFAPQTPRIDSDSLLRSYLEDEAVHIGPIAPIYSCPSFLESQSPPWYREFPKRLDEAAWMTSDFSPGRIVQASGPSTSGGMGRSRDRREIRGRSTIRTTETSPSQRTTVAGVAPRSNIQTSRPGWSIESSIQTSTQSELDGFGFIIVEGSFDRLPPFVHYDPPSDRTSVRRYAKWRDMLENAEENWEEICRVHGSLLKKRVRKGIPKDWRYRAWPLLTGGRMLQRNNPNVYARLVRGYTEWEDRILTDVHRTLPRNVFFAEQDGAGQRSLFNCLKAYAIHDPEVGYTQGMGSIVAILLLVMSEEEAFWTFAALMREEPPFPRASTAGPHVGCRRLFLEGLPLTEELLSKLKHLLNEKMPNLKHWLDQNGIASRDFATKWWMTLFCFVLPFHHVLRVWDIFFLEGWKMALRVGLVIMKCMESKLLNPEHDEHVMTILEASNIARSLPAPDAFIKAALNTRISKSLESWAADEAARL